jgi:hypothetical protein
VTTPASPDAPLDPEPDTLAGRVFAALYALPPQFKSDLSISGVRATDLFTFNASLGATIEEQVVDALNALRSSTWDQDEQYAQYRFVRQPQTFPDVVLKAAAPKLDPPILLGIELKGWYVLAKEREPSFRYRVTPEVCAPNDLLAVFPWALSRVISGSPQLFAPYVAHARYAAEYRNWHWRHVVRGGAPNGEIKISEVSEYFPSKAQAIGDEPVSDRGGNFGRFARTNLMDTFMDALFAEDLAGIPLDAWQRFLKMFGEQTPLEKIDAELDRMASHVTRGRRAAPALTVKQVRERLHEIVALLDSI